MKRLFCATAASLLAPALLLACVSAHAQTFIFDGSVTNVWDVGENWVDGVESPDARFVAAPPPSFNINGGIIF